VKTRMGMAGLYAGFFIISFLVSLALTFDARALGGLLEKAAGQANLSLTFEQAEMTGLLGLELQGVEISRLDRPGGGTTSLHRLRLSPKLSALPGALLSSRGKRPPRVAFSFSAWQGESKQRNLGGEVDFRTPGLSVDLDAANLTLEQIGPGLAPKFPPLTGKLNGKLRLEVGDRQKPATWDCALKLELFQAQLKDFQVMGMTVPGFNLGNANLELELKDGQGPIKALKLTEGDLPVNLSGTLALPESGPLNLGAARISLSGTITMSEENKAKLPLLATIVPAGGRYNYSGELKGLAPMLK